MAEPATDIPETTPAEAEYLEVMFWLDEAGLPITAANIARAMRLSPPSVHEMITRLTAAGFITRDADKIIDFTEVGREHATSMVYRHRLIECFLTKVMGISWEDVHEETERLEHSVSPALEERMRAAVGDATTCPHGHPFLPGEREQGSVLADVEPGADITVLRFENEAESILHHLKNAGLEPQMTGKVVEQNEDTVVIEDSDGGRHEIDRQAADTVTVRANPAPPWRPPLPDLLVASDDRYGR